MNSLELINAREEAKNTLRQRVSAKTEQIVENGYELRKRNRVSSESSSETIESEEVFACKEEQTQTYWFFYGLVFVAGVCLYYLFF